jgi:DNA-binding transcriptional ArsR family regulator
MPSSDGLDASVLKALGHPLRMRILTFITERGEASPVEMARAFDRSLATVSHHARVLRDLGYIELARTAPRRGAVEHYYRAAASPFIGDAQWAQMPVSMRRRVAAQVLRDIVKDAAVAAQRGGFDAAGAHVTRMLVDLDARGWRELSQAVLALLKRAEAIQQRSDRRRDAARGESTQPSELAILHFEVAPTLGDRRARPPRLP